MEIVPTTTLAFSEERRCRLALVKQNRHQPSAWRNTVGKKHTESPPNYSILRQPNPSLLSSDFDTKTHDEASKDEKRQIMRWVFLVFSMIWLWAAIVLPIVAFCLTKNLLSFSSSSAIAPPLYILYRITGYLFPKSREEYRIKAMKIRYGVEKHRKNKIKEQ